MDMIGHQKKKMHAPVTFSVTIGHPVQEGFACSGQAQLIFPALVAGDGEEINFL